MHREFGREGALLKMIELSYAAADDSEMMRAVCETLRQVVPFSSAVFMPVNQATMELQAGFCVDCSRAQMDRYLAHYAAIDPFVLRPAGPVVLNQSLLLSEVITAGELARSEFSDFQQQVPYRHAMRMLTGVAGQAVAVVSIHRQEHEGDFVRQEQAVLDCIGAHLARAVVLRRLTSDSLPRAANGLAVFARSGRTLYLNGSARRLLGGTSPIAVFAELPAEGSGVISLGAQTICLSRLPWSAASLLRPFALQDEAANSSHCGRRACHAAALRPEQGEQVPGAVIVVLRPFHPRTDLVRRLTHYGLSPRQSEIAAWALRGLTNSEIAQQISIGEQTVRDHFQEIYCRIGVRSRTELLAHVLGTNGSARPVRQLRGR